MGSQHVDRTVLRRGLGILGVAVRHEPVVFAVAVGGSAVYGAMTVAAAWVLGRVTDQVLVPAFRDGHTTSGRAGRGGAAVVAVVACSRRSASSAAGSAPG